MRISVYAGLQSSETASNLNGEISSLNKRVQELEAERTALASASEEMKNRADESAADCDRLRLEIIYICKDHV